jgi:Alkylmercury lyase
MNASCCDQDLLSGPSSSQAARDLGVRGFMTLWRRERRPITELTNNVGMVRMLSAAGRLELDDDGILVGVHGLVARPTAHRIEHAGRSIHTWCALDAIGVPAALALDATAITACPRCGVEMRVALLGGEPSAEPDLRLWLPGGPCSHLIDDFCRYANLYCSPEHLASVVPADQPGQAVDVAAAAAIGRTTWRDVAALTQDLTEEAL